MRHTKTKKDRKITAPKFEWSFLLPSYWLVWLSIILLYTVACLPYKVQLTLGKILGKLLQTFAKERYQIAKRNIALCFPQYSQQQRDKLLKNNFANVGMSIFETSMGWWWPTWRVAKRAEYENYQLIENILVKGKGVLVYAIHNMNLEFSCRVAGLKNPSVVFYRKHKNKLMEYMQYHGRTRANKYMIRRNDVLGLINALNNGEVCFYLPDQDYGLTKCEFAPFFAVPQVATTTGSLLFAQKANCETVFLVSVRTATGYKIKVLPGLDNFPSGDNNYDVTRINQMIETMIMIAPEQYLWLHKRFKTRPAANDLSLYD